MSAGWLRYVLGGFDGNASTAAVDARLPVYCVTKYFPNPFPRNTASMHRSATGIRTIHNFGNCCDHNLLCKLRDSSRQCASSRLSLACSQKKWGRELGGGGVHDGLRSTSEMPEYDIAEERFNSGACGATGTWEKMRPLPIESEWGVAVAV